MRTFQAYSERGLSVLPILLVLILATSASGQGLFGGLPGLPSFGSFSGGPYGCNERLCPKGGLKAYVGYMEDRNGATFSVNSETANLVGFVSARNHFTNRGVWFGLSGSTCFTPNLSFVGSGWYLVPSQTSSRQDVEFTFGTVQGREWDVKPQWWFVDGLFAQDVPGGLTLLAGLRYDYYDVRFESPSEVVVSVTLPSDTADNTSQFWIPLVGTQYALSSSMGNVMVRAVGFPTVLGNMTFRQTIGGSSRIETKGTHDSGYFLEVFAEYSKSFGPGTLGIFGRWNGLDARTTVDSDFSVLGGGIVANSSPRVTIRRQSWTVGGSVSLDFHSPL